jgi:ketosteroid isomerase-like protein
MFELFNKADFAGVVSLYTADATAFPPGSSERQGCNGRDVKKHGGARSVIRNSQPWRLSD